MLVLIGPSASGKTEVAKILIEKYKMKRMVTYTTRPIRINETNGVDYHFVTVDQFIKMKEADEFVETTFYNNNYYGSRKKDISNDKVVILDPSGLKSFYGALKDKIIAVFLETPESIRRVRMMKRNDKNKDIEIRIKNDSIIFHKDNIVKIDYSISNTDIDLENLAAEIYKIYQETTNKSSVCI